MHDANELISYLEQLARGDALTVRRVGEYVDWDEDVLVNAIYRWENYTWCHRGETAPCGNGSQGCSRHRTASYRGVLIALTRARATAADRAYNRRHRR